MPLLHSDCSLAFCWRSNFKMLCISFFSFFLHCLVHFPSASCFYIVWLLLPCNLSSSFISPKYFSHFYCLFNSFRYPIVMFLLLSYHLVCNTPLTKTLHLSCLVSLIYPQNMTTVPTPKLLIHSLCTAWVIHLCQFPVILIHVTYVMQACIRMFIPHVMCLSILCTCASVCISLLQYKSSFKFPSWALFLLPTHLKPMLSVVFFRGLLGFIFMWKVSLEKMVNAAVLINKT